MKKANLGFASILTIITLLLVGCNEKFKKEMPERHDEKPSEIVKAPDNIISLEQADLIYNNYTEHRASIIESYETQQRAPSEQFEVARFVDFDYDVLKEYIAFVDQEAKNAGVQKVTKMRLYFANYPDLNEFPNGKKIVHKRQNSIFMLPTLEKGGVNYGFYIGADGKPELISDWKAQTEKGMGFYQKNKERSHAGINLNFSLNSNLAGGQSLTLNYGGSGPPPKTDF